MTRKEINDKARQIREFLDACDTTHPRVQDALHRGILTVYANQTADEQATQSTREHNGQGFTGIDAQFGSAMAERVLDLKAGRSKYPSLSPRMYEAIRKLLKKYARQLAVVALEAQEAAAETVAA